MSSHQKNHNRFATPEAAAYIGVQPNTLAVWRSTGRHSLKYKKVGRLVFYIKSDLDEWLESRTKYHTGEV